MPGESTQSATLRSGYSRRTKVIVGAAAALCWLLTLSALGGGVSGALVLLPLLVSSMTTWLLAITFRSGFVADESSLKHATWRGVTTYLRSDFLSLDAVAGDQNQEPGLLLRFTTGVVLLSDARGCSDLDRMRLFLENQWRLSGIQQRPTATGPVDHGLVLEYETVHMVFLGLVTIFLATMASLGPMLWAAAVLALITGRTFYRMYSCQRISTDSDGFTVVRPFQPKLTIRWEEIRSIRYWHSLAQGGMILSAGSHTVRVYRCIQEYPRFNRLVHDRVPAANFAPFARLPWTIGMNQRRQAHWLVLAVMAGASLWFAANGGIPLAIVCLAVPGVAFALNVAAAGRRIEIGRDELRDVQKRFFSSTVRTFRRSNLNDMRLGRQLSVGGLWLKFGNERLEIANLDSEQAPEEILAVLRHEWNWEQPAPSAEEVRQYTPSNRSK